MFTQLEEKPKSLWYVRASFILGALLLAAGVYAGLQHRDFSVVWLVTGVGWLLVGIFGRLRWGRWR
jgi:hypothetical protein